MKPLITALILGSLISLNIGNAHAQSGLSISNMTDNRATYNSQIPQYEKFEITFTVSGTSATNPYYPHDAAPPPGIDRGTGISVSAVFTAPGGTEFRQPGFYYQEYQTGLPNDRDWYYPQGQPVWKVRFSPHVSGTWRGRLEVTDASGTTQAQIQDFTVVNSGNQGFIKVSNRDSRYFEYDNSNQFFPLPISGSINMNSPITGNTANFKAYGDSGANMLRHWAMHLYGTAWLEWEGSRGQYNATLPRPGLVPFDGSKFYQTPIKPQLAMKIDYEQGIGDSGWFDACRRPDDEAKPESIKPNTTYRFKVKYWGANITGPRNTSHSDYGLVVKLSNNTLGSDQCINPGNGTIVTTYGGNTTQTGNTITGTWRSGDSAYYLPRVHMALENVLSGAAYVDSISVREVMQDGSEGPEVIFEPSMQYEKYYPQSTSFAMDKVVEEADKNNLYLKMVIMETNDEIWKYIDNDGTFVINGEQDNLGGIYGVGRTLNKHRWLQQAWWRYLQARWGYSPVIHSWELVNEGEPTNANHHALTDELGKYMHCTVFGVQVGTGDSQKCSYDHPNDHMVTTSLSKDFPADIFWANTRYPNVDYADVHAYISTGWLRNQAYETDEALYHLDYSADVRSNLDSFASKSGIARKPIIRGEAGIDFLGQQSEQPDLARDTQGIWLHNFLWSQLDYGALAEMYWWGDNTLNAPGPDGQRGLYEIYKPVQQFAAPLKLNAMKYQNITSTSSNTNVRVVGQLSSATKEHAYIWVQHKGHTWRNVVNGVNAAAINPAITLGGFNPNRTLPIEVWNTYTGTFTPSSGVTDANGNLVINVQNLTTDVAYRIGTFDQVQPTPSSTPAPTPVQKPGDANNDGKVDGVDYMVWRNNYNTNGQGPARGDFNNSGRVDDDDYRMWLTNYSL